MVWKTSLKVWASAATNDRPPVIVASRSSSAMCKLVLDIDRERLLDRLERARVRRVGTLVADLERLWEKYQVSLTRIEKRRTDAATRLGGYLKELGYA